MTQVLNSFMYANTEHTQMVEFTLADVCKWVRTSVLDMVLV